MSLRTTVTSLLVAAVLVLGWNAVAAHAEGEGDVTARLASLEAQTKALRAENDYLLSREHAITRYVVSLDAAASALATGVGESRSQGFEAAAISAPSRTLLLKALDQLSHDLGTGVPGLSKADAALKQQAEAARREIPK